MKYYEPDKLSQRFHGPYPIVEINTNGTVVLQRSDNVCEIVNICKLVPYKGTVNATPEDPATIEEEPPIEDQDVIATV